MKQLSVWALHHKYASRLLIALIYVALNACAWLLGIMLPDIPAYSIHIVLLLFIATIFIYPAQKTRHRYKDFYKARKKADFLLGACTFLFMVCCSNGSSSASYTFAQRNVHASMQPPEVYFEKPGKNKIRFLIGNAGFVVKHWKQIRTHVREIRAALKKSGNAEKAALIILTIIIALGLLLLLAGLSCSIACSGAEGLAFMVALLGTGLIVFLAVLVIRRIQHGPKKLPKPEVIKV